MKIQEGRVRYKDRDDIVCLYGITDDGKQYYFLDETDTKKFANGNRIASTTLVEAIDPMYKASNIGVVDENGVEKIPCINRSIELVQDHDDVLLVELGNPITESVIEANQLRNDPLSATRLVSTPSVIKEKINNQMGIEGRYIFHDQFSEATIFDIDGNNLVNGELYSFIGYSNDKLYMAKNTADTEVTVYSLNKEAVNETVPVENTVESPAQDVVSPVENAVESPVEEAVSPVENAVESPVQDVVSPVENTVESPVEDVVPPVENTVTTEEPLGQEITIPTIDEDKVENVVEEDKIVEPIVTEEDDTQEVTFNTDLFNEDLDNDEEIVEYTSEPEESETDKLFFETKAPLVDTFSEINVSKIEDEEDEFDNEVVEEPVSESIMEESAKLVAGLVKQNKDLKVALKEIDERNVKLTSARKNASDRAKMLEQKNDALIVKIHGQEAKITKLESSNEILTAKTRDQEKLIDNQKREIDALRHQLEGKDELIRVVSEAKVLLGDDEDYQDVDYVKVA